MPRPLASFPYDSTVSSLSKVEGSYCYDLNNHWSCAGHFAIEFDSMKAA